MIVDQLRSWEVTDVSLDVLRSAVHDFLDFLHTVPLMTRLHIEHGRAAGPKILDRRAAIMEEFVTSLLRLLDQARRHDAAVQIPSRAVVAAVVGGLSDQVYERVRTCGIEGTDALEGPFVELLARLFIPHPWTNEQHLP